MLAVVVTVALVVAHLGMAVGDRAAARTAADAAALAGAGALVVSPAAARSAAEQAARRNGATLDAVDLDGDRVEVTVRVGSVTASAVATSARGSGG